MSEYIPSVGPDVTDQAPAPVLAAPEAPGYEYRPGAPAGGPPVASLPQQPQYQVDPSAVPSGTALYLRQLRFVVGDATGKGLDLSQLRISFQVRKSTVQTPNSLVARVYNLADATTETIQNEFTQVLLQVGYAATGLATLFQGQVQNYAKGRESQLDTFLDIQASDGDQAYNFAVVSTALAAGHGYQQQAQALSTTTAPYGVTAPPVPPSFPPTIFPRGRVLFGMVRDLARALGFSTGTTWSIQDGAHQYSPNSAAAAGSVIVLNSRTGLIGTPQRTIDGIVGRALLNPLIRAGRAIQIDQKLINQLSISLDYAAVGQQQALAPSIQADGFYRIVAADHTGDNRGNDWYTDFTCVGLNAPPSISSASQGLT